MKKFFVIITGLLLSYTGLSQPCLHEGRGFYSQEDIDRFHEYYPNCNEIQGDVIISGSDITNLYGLNGVIAIDGYLDIAHTERLSSLSGLDSLVNIGGHLGIYSNLALMDLQGMNRLISIGANFEIFDNPVLSSLKGFDTLANIARDVWIASNPSLVRLAGLKNLDSIGGMLQINNNNSLKNLAELAKLTDMGGELIIYSNHSLNTLHGIDSIHAGTISALYIYDNDTLSFCDVFSLCRYFEIPWANITIYNNRIGCNSRSEVKAGCDTSGVENLAVETSLLIYPNPAFNNITIETSEQSPHLGLSVFDVNGQELLSRKINHHLTNIEISYLPKGIYFIRLIETRKLIKE
ncbi:MAG: T9SS type A sorting domain-containing protein [Bacteroidetes bacterium]|nr:T9SS type A sorting domain-containing protein [Bacteroidota bacterium]